MTDETRVVLEAVLREVLKNAQSARQTPTVGQRPYTQGYVMGHIRAYEDCAQLLRLALRPGAGAEGDAGRGGVAQEEGDADNVPDLDVG